MDNIKLLQPKPGVKLLAVKVPEGAVNFRTDIIGFDILLFYDENQYSRCVKIPFDAEILGLSDQLEEDVCRELVVRVERPGGISYNNYLKLTYTGSAKESFASFLHSEGVYSVNPLGEKPSIVNHDVWYSEEEWQQAEANTGTRLILRSL